jgi:hypothetical protein
MSVFIHVQHYTYTRDKVLVLLLVLLLNTEHRRRRFLYKHFLDFIIYLLVIN